MMNLYQIDFGSIKITNIVINYHRKEHFCVSMIYYQNKIRINNVKQILNLGFNFRFLKLKYIYQMLLDYD